MPTLSENISGTLDLAGGVSAVSHPNLLGRTGRIINQVARMMMREARLSEQNQYIKFLTLNSPQKELAIPSIVDPNSIVTVELLEDVTNDVRSDIPIVDRVDINAREGEGRPAVCRFGRPTRLRFSWDPILTADTLYVGYENLPVDALQPGDIPNLPESFHDCLQYRSAALVKETVLDKECGGVFMDTMAKIERQWSEWCRRSAEERPVQRPAFGTLDYGDPMELTIY